MPYQFLSVSLPSPSCLFCLRWVTFPLVLLFLTRVGLVLVCHESRFRYFRNPCDRDPVGARNRCHLSNWRFNPETVHFWAQKGLFCRPCLCPNGTKQSILAKIHFFTRSQNLEGKITIFTVLKWGKGRNHYENHDLGHNHWKRSAKRPKINPFWTQNVHGFQMRTPIWQMAPISRIYIPVTPQQKIENFKFFKNSLEILNVYFWGKNVYFWGTSVYFGERTFTFGDRG